LESFEEKGLATNSAYLAGVVMTPPVYSHKSYGETFYSFHAGIDRKSGYRDVIPVIVSERLIWNMRLCQGEPVVISGQVRTYNEEVGGRNKLNVVVFARDFQKAEDGGADMLRFQNDEWQTAGAAAFERAGHRILDKDRQDISAACQTVCGETGAGEGCDAAAVSGIRHENQINLEGYICKKPISRCSPLGREICDIMLAVNRMYGKSDYIPCIAWGRNAGYAGSLEVGAKIEISGRIQSREYRKKDEEGNTTTKTAYEVSILRIEDVNR